MKRPRLLHAAGILFVAFVLTWPAIYNGLPLLYPDSMSYLEAGPRIAAGLLSHDFNPTYPSRGFLYALVIYPLHWNTTLWPIAAIQSLLVAWILWLLVKTLVPARTLLAYLTLALALALFTDLAWFTSYIMPDILGPPVYLAFFLLALSPDRLSRPERWTLAAVACWCITAHSTHLLLAATLCLLLPLALRLLHRKWLRPAATLAAITLVAAAAQVALHARLYGEPSLNGKRPPFLLARVIADGPGMWYIRDHCNDCGPYLCQHREQLEKESLNFLWADNGLWESATPDQQEQIRAHEMPIVLGTLCRYPWPEFQASTHHAWQQFNAFAFYNYGPDPWIPEMFPSVMPAQRDAYLNSRQAKESLPLYLLTNVQYAALLLSLATLAATLLKPRLRRRWTPELATLALLVCWILLANAAIAGILSNVEDRYQARVIWSLPLLATLALITTRRSPSPAPSPS